jgi:tetratricopeptide (TPR) repeat protein
LKPKQKTNIDVRSLTLQKKRIFFTILICIPIVFLVCLELSLRWFDYGVDVSLFGRQDIYGKTYYVMNPNVKFRYFGSMPFAPSTSLHYFLVPKPQGVYRIFCLGGSTTAGYPYYFNSSFPSFLLERLQALFPQKNIEIINLGMTATNSFTTLDIAHDIMECQPDLIIVYDGHNEFYGALGVASNQTSGSFRFLTRLRLRLIHERSFQLLQNTIFKFTALFSHKDMSTSPRTIMEKMAYGQYIPYGNHIYKVTYSIFQENLNDLKDLCQSKGVPLILGTQASNLRDQPPFISENLSDLSQQERTLFQQYYKKGVEHQSNRLIDSAIIYYKSALTIDSLYADVHYRLAQCLASSGDKQEALHQYILARDYDELRFRMDSKFNKLIHSMDDHQNCFVADVEKTFQSMSQDSLIGYHFMTEHLHPNLWGNFVLAKIYAQVMREHGLLASQHEWMVADTLNEGKLWQSRCVTDLDELMGIQSVNVVTSGWPFKTQSPTIEYIDPNDTLKQIAQSLATGKLGWMDAHMLAIDFYRQRNDWLKVEQEYKTLINMYPHTVGLYMQLAKVYFDNRRFDDMKIILLRSLQIYPTLLAYHALGNIMMDKDDPVSALKYFEKTDDFVQTPDEKLQNEYTMSTAYIRAGELQKARARLLHILNEKPNFEPALRLLNMVNDQIEMKPKHKK